MRTSYLVSNTSDFHLEHSAKVVLDYVMAEFKVIGKTLEINIPYIEEKTGKKNHYKECLFRITLILGMI